MRVLFVNDGGDDAGGVQRYIDATADALTVRGHAIAFGFCTGAPREGSGRPHVRLAEEASLDELARWAPDVVYSHNMGRLDVERALLDRFPVVKFMHGFFGTCVSGQKMHEFPRPAPCQRTFGPMCLALYGPRRCGRLSPVAIINGYQWATEQRKLFPRYQSIVVPSTAMRNEYVRNGAPASGVHVNPLFPRDGDRGAFERPARTPKEVLFLGRMTKLKGGELLVRAVADAARRLGRQLRLVMAGDGPSRAGWQSLAEKLRVDAAFPGWLADEKMETALRSADVLAVPSVWPEPFGFVGLEAARFGVPAVAFDVGGVREWLDDGVTGFLAPGDPPTAAGLACALETALSDGERLRAFGMAARSKAEAMSLAAHMDRLIPVLEHAADVRLAPCSS